MIIGWKFCESWNIIASMNETLKPNPGNLVRNRGLIYRIGCGACDEQCEAFRKSGAMKAVTEGETNGYCDLKSFDKSKDPPEWIVDVLEDKAFVGQPVTVFCGEKKHE
jgi:hypothetical protein